MSSFRSPDLLERRNNSANVKKVMLEKFRAAGQDPAFEQERLKRFAVNEARVARTAEREAAKKVREAELVAQAARAAELAAQAQCETEKAEALAKAKAAERDAALAAEKKAERDARYAARKTAKKIGDADTSGYRSITTIQYPLWVKSDVAVKAPTTVCALVRLTNRPIATRKVFQIRMMLQHLTHVYLGTILKSLNAVDYVLPSRQQFDLLRLRLGLAGSDRMLEQNLVGF